MMVTSHHLQRHLHGLVICRWYYRPQELELSNGLTAEDREVFKSDERGIHPVNSGKQLRCSADIAILEKQL
jgi:uncharacterized protein YodC (DUF2158 family)